MYNKIILNIIDKANESAFKDTAYGVIQAAEYYYAASQLDLEGPMQDVKMQLPDSRLELKGDIPNGWVTITRDGDIEIAVQNGRYCVTKGFEDTDITITEDPENCKLPSVVSDITLNTESVSVINGGTYQLEATVTPTTALNKTLTYTSNNEAVATVSNGVITGVKEGNTTITVTTADGSNISKTINVTVNEREIILSDVMVSTTNNCVTSGACTPAEIKAGIKVNINVKEGTPYDFYVLADDGNKVTLIMDRCLGEYVKWYTSMDNSQGPTTALEELASLTNDWEIPEFTCQLSGLGEDKTTQKYQNKEVTGKARLITYAEANAVGCSKTTGSCPDWMYANLDNNSVTELPLEYWASTASANGNFQAWGVRYDGRLYSFYTNDSYFGVRPVIELSK